MVYRGIEDARRLDCDIVVVGAGPGGSTAARYAALGGLDVILIEKKAEIGSPLRCAEGVSKKWFDALGIKTDRKWISAEIMRMKIVSPSGFTMVSDESEKDGSGRGYVLERHLFDKALAAQAADAGVRIMMRTACTGTITDGGRTVGIRATEMGEPVEIYAKCIIAADGFESQASRWAGLDTSLGAEDIDTCLQYRMTNVDIDPNTCEFRIGSDAPGGYIWLFPKGDGIANVGIGIQAARCTPEAGPKYHLDRFVKGDPRLRDGQILEMVAGAVSSSKPEHSVTDNLIAVGDAARFINPLTGGGIHEACLSGMLAGKTVTECASIGDFSKMSLSMYERMWEGEVGRRFSRNMRIKEKFVGMSDEALDEMIVTFEDVGMRKMKVDTMIRIISEKNPSILRMLGIEAPEAVPLNILPGRNVPNAKK